jgi:ActR/RegA family two-component response regulator
VVLVVDDEPVFCRALSRVLEKSFDEVHVATVPAQAEQVLESFPITHLVCDYRLGEHLPPGTVFVSKWRRRFANIRRAIVLTGAMDYYVFDVPPEVDAVRAKGIDNDDLVATITGVDEPTRPR